MIWTDPVGGTARSHDVTLADLGLRPIDLLQLVKPDDVQAMTELDDRILGVVLAAGSPRADADLRIRYQSAPTGKLSIFEVSALIRRLRLAIERPAAALQRRGSGNRSSTGRTTTCPPTAPGWPDRRPSWTRSAPTSPPS